MNDIISDNDKYNEQTEPMKSQLKFKQALEGMNSLIQQTFTEH